MGLHIIRAPGSKLNSVASKCLDRAVDAYTLLIKCQTVCLAPRLVGISLDTHLNLLLLFKIHIIHLESCHILRMRIALITVDAHRNQACCLIMLQHLALFRSQKSHRGVEECRLIKCGPKQSILLMLAADNLLLSLTDLRKWGVCTAVLTLGIQSMNWSQESRALCKHRLE